MFNLQCFAIFKLESGGGDGSSFGGTFSKPHPCPSVDVFRANEQQEIDVLVSMSPSFDVHLGPRVSHGAEETDLQTEWMANEGILVTGWRSRQRSGSRFVLRLLLCVLIRLTCVSECMPLSF